MRLPCCLLATFLAATALADDPPGLLLTTVSEPVPEVRTGSTCCSTQHLDNYRAEQYRAPVQQGFDTRREPDLIEFRLLVTDSVRAPPPDFRPVVDAREN
jgi:hypothetical protein